MSSSGFQIPGYTLQRQLGEGGMAVVYLALQRSLNRKVAIKMMRHDSGDETAEKRFVIEGQTLARLPHPNIVAVYDIVQADNFDYIVMEYLEGGSLSERMRTGWLTLNDLVGIVVQIAAALQHAHDQGVVHRDLKPDNILFRDPRTPVITDFGIARLSNSPDSRITELGMVVGTPIYMSPEQASGGNIDGRADQYSLGVLFYEMLAKKPPFEGDTAMQIAYKHVNERPPPLPMEYAFAQPLIDRMLAKKAADRFPDLKTFARELRNVLVGSPVLQRRLQIEPGQNVSEKLRAMGFSDSQLQGRTQSMANVTAELPAGALVHQLLETSELALEPVVERRAKPRTEESKRSPWPILIGLVLLAAAGAGVYLYVL